jgi:hypothetical protein
MNFDNNLMVRRSRRKSEYQICQPLREVLRVLALVLVEAWWMVKSKGKNENKDRVRDQPMLAVT